MGEHRYRGVAGRFLGWFAVAASAGLLLLAACAREGPDEMSWARAALERNKALEVVATDPQTRTFTVRMKASGELRTVRTNEIVAIPPALADATPPLPATPSSTAPQAAPAEKAVAQAESLATPGEAAPTEREMVRSEPLSPAPQTAAGAADASGGRVLESGPGYSISAAQAPGPAAARGRESTASAPLERRHEPIVCQGSRLLHIDNRNLVFDGDAVSALDGCEIHITNTHISASGVGVAARAANVHIDNSQIEGDQASIDASDGAQIYAASSRFKGLSRRLDTSKVHDLGGNIWN
jgi:hypothetical protein